MKNNIIYLFGSVVGAGIPFLFLPILTRVLTPEEYGVMNLLFTIYSICVPLVSIGLSNYLHRVYFDNNSLSHSTFLKCIKVFCIWALFLCALTFIVVGIFVDSMFNAYAFIVPLLVLSAAFNSVFMIRLSLYNAQDKAICFIKYQLLYTSVIFVTTLFLLFVLNLAELSRIYGIIFADIIFSIVSMVLIYKILDKSLPNKENVESDYLKYGFGLVPHIIASILLSSLDKFIIAKYMSMDDLSTYVIAVQYTSILMIVAQGLSKEWTRFFMSNPYDKTINKKAGNLFLSIATLSIVLYLCKDIFYGLFIGGAFIINNEVVQLLIASQLFHCFYMILTVQISYDKKTHILSMMTLISLVINFIVSMLLVKSYGLIGVGIGTLAGMGVKFFLTLYYVLNKRIFGVTQ
ncbi:lipopolysaccharide biosynthesis protein [Colwellia hornerae]|uniref:Oligosaccharide flippase family protein n=1 Tax=Colwellia hornerae TaxID=89402 RepID=A0A5C6QJP5_9GAMM|nr:oligosaccharide flippase family protein [Colwellia hornerae]TWX54030.1 oligosaccharide flippase family protein [Colwellia hornerae]TWX60805.1 oligosaccharide flippase family protein [Colwellia hornerae]TWX69135.1 oligosaccharide flippase family protein [Colwellia hornerae]